MLIGMDKARKAYALVSFTRYSLCAGYFFISKSNDWIEIIQESWL